MLGAPAGDVEVRRKIGFLPEDFRFYEWLTAERTAASARAPVRVCLASSLRERVPALIDLVGLTPHRDKRLQNFSKGMLQRIGLAQALIHEPELIFLDEPTSGLDPMGRRMVRDIIRAQRDRGATVFLNSHLLSEIEITCDQVVFIREGEVVTSRDMRALQEEEVRVVVRARKLTPRSRRGLGAVERLRASRRRAADASPRARATSCPTSCVISSPPARTSTSSRRSGCRSKSCSCNIMGEDRGL